MAAKAADASDDLDTRVRVRGRAAIALGYEGAALPVADVFADQAIALSNRPSLGLLNAVFGKAHTAALRGDHTAARRLLTEGRRIFDRPAPTSRPPTTPSPTGASTSSSPCPPPASATRPPPPPPRTAELPASLPRFATHLQMHRGLMPARSGDTAGGTAYARAALDALLPEKHSLTLRLLMAEVERS
ncbi:hypothetical protein ACFQ7B_05755 [Streptomyces erythrochromogenes]|uniref:hypothetical protein n=1 Tax=Streptomyces erythrochromogenes TaxID=285574 RepID=UPI003692CE1C